MDASVSVRALAVAGPKVWLAVRGQLGIRSLAALCHELTERSRDGQRELYLDLAEVTIAVGLAPQWLLSADNTHLHLMEAPACLARSTPDGPRLTVHHHRVDAWTAWSHDEHPKLWNVA